MGQELIPYRIAYTFDRSPRILVECQVTPLATEKEVGAFLAMCFAVPQMREWAANTMDGIVREDVKETAGRSYESSKLPLDAASPLVGFINGDGTSLRVSDIRSEGPAGVQNVIIHGKAFFLAWLSDAPVRVTAVPHRVRFTLSLGHGDPVR